MPHKVATIVSKTMPASIFLACLSGFVMQFTFSIIYGSGKVVKKKRTRKNKKRGRPGNTYRKAGNFRGRKLWRLGGKILADKLLRIAPWCRQKTPRPPISRRKLSRISHKTAKFEKSPRKFPAIQYNIW